MMLSRRGLLIAGLLAGSSSGAGRAIAATGADPLAEAIAALEQTQGGRLGVCLLDTATGRRVEHRGDERFPLCSTFKVLAAARVLTQVDRGAEHLDRHIAYAKERLVPYSPETERHVGDGMALGDIAKAALTLSDNTAGNLMLDTMGGPAGLTAFVRTLDDSTTRLDRPETTLNEATPGDPRDTTTPAAMAANLQKILLGDILSPASRDQLTAWMVANRTGDTRLRAGLPKSWRVADKTGAGDHAATNDVAVVWPPGRSPIVVTVYFTESPAPVEARNATIAAVGRLAGTM